MTAAWNSAVVEDALEEVLVVVHTADHGRDELVGEHEAEVVEWVGAGLVDELFVGEPACLQVIHRKTPSLRSETAGEFWQIGLSIWAVLPGRVDAAVARESVEKYETLRPKAPSAVPWLHLVVDDASSVTFEAQQILDAAGIEIDARPRKLNLS